VHTLKYTIYKIYSRTLNKQQQTTKENGQIYILRDPISRNSAQYITKALQCLHVYIRHYYAKVQEKRRKSGDYLKYLLVCKLIVVKYY